MPYSIYESIKNNQTFPVNIFVAPIQSSTYHWHNEYEMIGILKGSVYMQVESEQVRLNEGDIYLVNPNVIHAIKEVENEGNLCMFVQMSRELFALDEEDNKDVRFYLDSTGEEEPEKGFAYFYRKMAEVIDAGANYFGGVCVNLPYHPGWGRAQEVYGEDSYLLGEMGSALVRGVQEKGVIACVKHFAFNSMENSRFKVSITCDKRAEREIFLKHFKKCIDAGAGSVMSAYNRYQGAMCGENEYLLKQVLRLEWDFDGFTICDFVWGVKDTVASASNGLDIEMPITHFYGEKLVEAVNEGKISEEIIND